MMEYTTKTEAVEAAKSAIVKSEFNLIVVPSKNGYSVIEAKPGIVISEPDIVVIEKGSENNPDNQ